MDSIQSRKRSSTHSSLNSMQRNVENLCLEESQETILYNSHEKPNLVYSGRLNSFKSMEEQEEVQRVV